MWSEKYLAMTEALKTRFVDNMLDEQLVMSQSEYKQGTMSLKGVWRELVDDVVKTETEYEYSYNQICKAFFGAAIDCDKLTVN